MRKQIILIAFFAISLITDAQQPVISTCSNEDFEQQTTGFILTGPQQVNGWLATDGSHTLSAGSNLCNLNGCCAGGPNEMELIVAPNGYIDPLIGACYPIFSVFGSSPSHSSAASFNPQLVEPMRGNNFFRLNTSIANSGMASITKTMNVSSSNALFRFAYINVTGAAHSCCDGAGMQVKLYNSSSSSPIACPAYTATTVSGQCPLNPNSPAFYETGSNCQPSTTSSAVVFNKWKIVGMDLTPYIGQTIIITIVASDCSQGDHYGYTYFDAQCSPMHVYANNIVFDASTPTVLVNSCGSANICIPDGLGPYSWSGPGLGPGYSIPSFSNICIPNPGYFNQTYTITMNPVGACNPIMRELKYQPHTSPVLSAPPPYDICTTPTVTIGPIIGGSSNLMGFSWTAPASASMSSNSSPSVTVNAPGVYTVIAHDVPSPQCMSVAHITVTLCSGLDEYSSGLKAEVFPNPAEDVLIIRLSEQNKNAEVKLFNIQGELLISHPFSELETRMDLSEMPSGIYIVQISGKGTGYYKVVKE